MKNIKTAVPRPESPASHVWNNRGRIHDLLAVRRVGPTRSEPLIEFRFCLGVLLESNGSPLLVLGEEDDPARFTLVDGPVQVDLAICEFLHGHFPSASYIAYGFGDKPRRSPYWKVLPGQVPETTPVAVTMSCALKPICPESTSEDLIITVTAKAPGMVESQFTPNGWKTASNFAAQKQSKAERSPIAVPDRTAQKYFPRVLESLSSQWDGCEWRVRLTQKTPARFASWLESLPPDFKVSLDWELATLRDKPLSGKVSLDLVEADIDWFDLKLVLNVGDTTLTPEELKLLINARGSYVRLGKKGWRRLKFHFTPEDDESLARLGLHARDFGAQSQRLHVLQLADDAAKKFLPEQRVEEIQRRASKLKARVTPDIPSEIKAQLHPYQLAGFHFLAYLTANHFGGVLADDMGLGKTLQTLAWLQWLRNTAESKPPTRRCSPVHGRVPRSRAPRGSGK